MAPTTTSSSPAVARPTTWAQIVKGVPAAEPARQPAEEEEAEAEAEIFSEEEEEVVQPLQPARRGERLCRCVGQVLVMLRHYGWIAPLDPIEHPDSHKNGGRIYVAAADVEPGNVLAAGDRVSFFLYVDMQGLGAEGCSLASACPARGPADVGLSAGAAEFVPAGLSAGAAEFVPATVFKPGPSELSADAAVFKPSPSELCADATAFEPLPRAVSFAGQAVLSARAAVFDPRPQRLPPQADEFVPQGGMSAGAAVFVPAKPTLGSVLQFNDAYLSDSEDSEDEGGAEAGDELSSHSGEPELSDGSVDSRRRRADYPVPGGPQGHVEWDDDLDVVVLCAPLKARGTALSAGSTSAGEHSDSEEELVSDETLAAALIPVGMPPGLSVLAS
mmetsp:Transcript_91782/g.213437  ORF Transcript_91782/g.213437 Transcript_91782/m.213437 type:complete len:388 (-) Transcript_91782:46-1209(-)